MNENDISIFPLKPLKVGAIIFSGYSFKSEDFQDEGIPVVKIKNIKDRRIVLDDVQHFSHSKITEKLDKFFLNNKDILIAMTGQGSVGRVGIFRKHNHNKVLVNQRVGKFITDEVTVNNDYLYYIISSPRYEQILFDMAQGSGQPNLSPSQILSTKIPLPPLPEQRAIAEILSSIDDKIELNNQMNRTLEAMAQAIFKQWFVDFEFPLNTTDIESLNPLRRGRQTGCFSVERGQEAQNAFDSRVRDSAGEVTYKSSGGKMIDSELGPIPVGWRVGTIDDIAEVVGGGTPSTKVESYFVKDAIPWITPKDLSGYTYKYIQRGSTDITEEALSNSSARMLPTGTVLFSSRAPIGYIAIAENSVSTNQGFKSLIPKNGIKTEYLYQYIKMITPDIESRASGSTFKEISGSAMKQIKVIVPENGLIDSFEEIIKPLNEQIQIIKDQDRTLSTLRDSLLPKLMSGELRVPEEIVKRYEEMASEA